MSVKQAMQQPRKAKDDSQKKPKQGDKVAWEKPKLEDVSAEVMAQPYIRFT